MATELANAKSAGREGGRPRGRKLWIAAWTPYIIAIFFALRALQGVSGTDIVDTDAARHAMNGALIYDMVRTGHITDPLDYAKSYYSHLPSVSMPYHPPGFPMVEALFFAVFGVHLLAARLAIAVAVALCALLLYRLVLATLGSRVLAGSVTVTMLSLWTVQMVARDVMLEFPALVLILAAMCCLPDPNGRYPLGRGLMFAILASVAVWTKQHALFLGAMPFLSVAFSGQWRRFREKTLWISLVPFCLAVAAQLFIAQHFNGTGLDQVGTSAKGVRWNALINARYYGAWIGMNVLGLPGIFAACSLAVYWWAARTRGVRKPRLALYLAWIIPLSGLLLVTTGSVRYLFFLFPPVIVLAYSLMFQGCSSLWGERRAWYLPVAFAGVWVVYGFLFSPESLLGPGKAAEFIVHGTPTHILYAGEADGNFIFAVRSLDSKLQTTVIPAGKVPGAVFDAAALERFCRRFGVQWIVFENVPGRHSWSWLRYAQLPFLNLEQSLPLTSTRTRWEHGTIDIYRVEVPEAHPGSTLVLPVPKIGRRIGVKL